MAYTSEKMSISVMPYSSLLMTVKNAVLSMNTSLS